MDDTHTTSSQELLRVLTALADENRFRIVELLADGAAEMSCGAIGAALGLSPSLISHHLAILEGSGLIARRRDGLCTLNRLRQDTLSHHLDTLARLVGGNGAR
ncbi:MAG: ArsR/SmtB family transcription factor [Gemmatimonadota bacterium]